MPRLVLSLDDELLERLETEAERRGTPLQELVLEALDWWVDAMEATQDLADSETSLTEHELEGGIDAFEYFRGRAREDDPQG